MEGPISVGGRPTNRIYDGGTGEEILRFQGGPLPAPFNHDATQTVRGFTISQNTPPPELLDVATGATIRLTDGPMVTAMFNAAGDKLATASLYGVVILYNTAGKEILRNTLGGKVMFLEFNPAGDTVIIGSEGSKARLWNIETNKTLLLQGHSNDVILASFSPDGNKLVTGSKGGTAKVWDVRMGELLHTLESHEGAISSAWFNPKGDKILTASTPVFTRSGSITKKGITRIWDAKTGNLLHTLDGQVAIFNQAGDKIMVGVGNVARIVDLEPFLKSQEFLANEIVLRQAIILNAIFETIEAREIVKKYGEKAFLPGAQVLAPEDIVFDFNRYPHLWEGYVSLPEPIKGVFDPYIKKPA
jgi:hypothetical protein